MTRLVLDTLVKYFALVAVWFLAGCLEHSNANLRKSGIVYCSEGSPSTFNPQLDTSGTTVDASSHQLYDRLLEFDPQTSKIVPGLASSWKVSRDGLIYTFQLRKQVSFHTTPYHEPSRFFNANDVMFSINRWRDKNHPFHNISDAEYPYFFSLGLDSLIKDVVRINGYRVEIHLSKPDSSFLANLATDFAIILSEEYAENLLAQNTPQRLDEEPIGTGPFKFVKYQKDRHIRYARHEGYWQEKDVVQQLVYDITPSSSLRLAKLMTGECDVISLPAHSELDIIRERNNLVLDEKPGLNVGYWAFNTSKAPFDNPEVRRALAMAIDKTTILEAVYFGSAIKATGLIPPSSWAYQADLRDASYNPLMARELLEKNNIGSDFEMDIWAMPVERTYNPNALMMAELIQGYLEQVGITVNIVSFEWSNFRRRLQGGAHDSVLIGWSADNGDPDNFYRPLLSCAAIESGTNRAKWCNPLYDEVINEALTYDDVETRAALYQTANAIVADQMPLVPIAHAYRYQAFRNDVTNLDINPFGGIRFGGVKKLQ
ncbi:MAG: ABC transporter substrate-binding protein [Alteromonadaceae bacterium]|nr:ABC transporter substrate-binding protein [Alteromonadaceae bacterium]